MENQMIDLSALVWRIDRNVREVADVFAVKMIVPLHFASTRGSGTAGMAVHDALPQYARHMHRAHNMSRCHAKSSGQRMGVLRSLRLRSKLPQVSIPRFSAPFAITWQIQPTASALRPSLNGASVPHHAAKVILRALMAAPPSAVAAWLRFLVLRAATCYGAWCCCNRSPLNRAAASGLALGAVVSLEERSSRPPFLNG